METCFIKFHENKSKTDGEVAGTRFALLDRLNDRKGPITTLDIYGDNCFLLFFILSLNYIDLSVKSKLINK